MVDGVDEVANEAFARAIGEELRRAREALGWTRTQMSALLPSGNKDRTLLAYEHGLRQLTPLKLAELSQVLQVDPAAVHPDGIAEIEPTVARNLALFIGCSHQALATHLARFTLENEIHEDTRAPARTA